MTIKRKISYGALIVLALIILFPVIKIPLILYNLEQGIRDHLIHVRGYKEEEILNVEPHLGHLPSNVAYVYFKDEPNYIYTYIYRNGKWYQFGPEDILPKSKHFEPKDQIGSH